MKPEQSTIHILSANLGRRLGPQRPDEVVRAAVAHLRGDDTARRLRGSWVTRFGDDGHLLMTHTRGADSNVIHLLVYRIEGRRRLD
jgi:fructose 1,6-bisphosphatase